MICFLITSLVSWKIPTSSLLTKSASVAQRLNSEPTLGYRTHRRGFPVRQNPVNKRTAHTKCGLHLFASSLAAALPAERRVLARRGWAGEKSGLSEQPAMAMARVCEYPDLACLFYSSRFSIPC